MPKPAGRDLPLKPSIAMVENENAAHPGPHACRRFYGRHDVWSAVAMAAVVAMGLSSSACSHQEESGANTGEELLYTVGDTSLTVALSLIHI